MINLKGFSIINNAKRRVAMINKSAKLSEKQNEHVEHQLIGAMNEILRLGQAGSKELSEDELKEYNSTEKQTLKIKNGDDIFNWSDLDQDGDILVRLSDGTNDDSSTYLTPVDLIRIRSHIDYLLSK
jgi:hypothetical protein